MPRTFWRATAEAVVAAVEATFVSGRAVDSEYVAEFTQLTKPNAKAALDLAVDLGLLKKSAGLYSPDSPLCRALVSADQRRKATALRVVLEDYAPFVRFRERLLTTTDVSAASRQVKQLLELTPHQDDVKETLLSLGQYSQALVAEGGGAYRPREDAATYELHELAKGCESDAAAEQLIRARVGARALERVSREDVVVPLANALQRARATDGRGAVVAAGNAVESFLAAYATRVGVNVTGKNGINAKADELAQQNRLPKKLQNVSKYLGHVRNAADHGIDAEVGAPWNIRTSTGLEYVFVACSFIAAVIERELGGPVEL